MTSNSAGEMTAVERAQRIRHNKRGTEYDVVGSAFLQTDTPLTDMEPLVVYRGSEGQLWVRPEKEFTPDRFTLLPAPSAPPPHSQAAPDWPNYRGVDDWIEQAIATLDDDGALGKDYRKERLKGLHDLAFNQGTTYSRPHSQASEVVEALVKVLRYHGRYCLDHEGEQSRAMLDAADMIEHLTAATPAAFTPCDGCDGYECDWAKGHCAYPGAGKSLDALSRQAPQPAAAMPNTSTEYHQQRGAAWDIIDEAIESFDGFMLDDDYDYQRVLNSIIERIKERRALYFPAVPSEQGKA